MTAQTNAFLSGASVVASAGIAFFFFRFWRRTHDRLFGIFALAFAVFGANRAVLMHIDEASENATYVYLVRLAVFMLIAVAILDKNRKAKAPTAE